LSLKIFYDGIDFRFTVWSITSRFVKEVIRDADKVPGDLNFILTTDSNLRKINVEFLNHDYDTDVITFEDNDGIKINGEIYISIDTVKNNSRNYEVSLEEELTRVIIHGVLHLLGYDDKTDKERGEMRKQEDYWLAKMGYR